MTELRWILLGIGILVIGGIYFWSRRSGGVSDPAGQRREPSIGGASSVDDTGTATGVDLSLPAVDPVPDTGDDLTVPFRTEEVPEPTAPEPPVADKIVKLHLVASEEAEFSAAKVVASLRAEGLRYAHFDLFHQFEGEGNPGPDAQPLYSVSNMLKPGTFDLETLADTSMRGISLFLVLPNPGDAVAVFADMLATGRRLAATLGGQLVDTQGCSISRQSASHMREEIVNYQLSARTSADAQPSEE